MLCEQCGEKAKMGAFFCGSCGRPLGFSRDVEVTPTEPGGMSDVPPPEKSREEVAFAATGAKALCSRCMGAYLETELITVDGEKLCGDCSTLTASRTCGEMRPENDSQITPSRVVRIADDSGGTRSGGFRQVAMVMAVVVAVAGIFAVVALPGSDRIDRLLGGAGDGDGGFRLAQTYEMGASFEYGMVTTAKISMNGERSGLFGNSMSGDFEMEMVGLIRIDVLSVDGDGNGRLRLKFSGFDAVLRGELDGRPIENTVPGPLKSLCRDPVIMTLDPYGKTIDRPEWQGAGQAGLENMSELFVSGLEEAPRGELQVGDKWSSRTAIPMNGESIGVVAEYEVLGRKNYLGRTCVVISVEGSLAEGLGKVALDLGAGFDVDVEMKGAILIDERNGCLVKSAVDAKVDVSASAPGVEMDMEMELSVDVDLK